MKEILKNQCNECLIKTVRVLTFKYSLSWSTLFEIINENPSDESGIYTEKDEYVDDKIQQPQKPVQNI